MTHRIVAIRRYPVKSMGGEALDAVEVERRGLRGDRAYALRDVLGRLASGKNSMRFRRLDGVFGYRAFTRDANAHPGGLGACESRN